MRGPYGVIGFILLALVSALVGNFGANYLWPQVKRHLWLFRISFPLCVTSIGVFAWANAYYKEIDKIPSWLGLACLAALALPCLVWAFVLLRDKSGDSVEGIPRPPNKFLAHHYTLFTTKNKKLIGRKAELKDLTQWISRKRRANVRVLVAWAFGGMGKSALMWAWLASLEPKPLKLAGAMWWSFYALNASFDRFLTDALAYVKGMSQAEAAALPFDSRMRQLVEELRKRRFLVVLDGFERLLVLYAKSNAANLSESEAEAEISREAAHPAQRKRLTQTADRRVGEFLRMCAEEGESRILITSRHLPADLEKRQGGKYEGCGDIPLQGLSDEEAPKFWRAMGAKGSHAKVKRYLQAFGNHPLLIQVLAGLVNRQAGGSFDAWLRDHPNRNPAAEGELVQVQTDILDFAFLDLSEAERRTLGVITAFRTPIDFDTAADLLVRTTGAPLDAAKPFSDRDQMEKFVGALKDRGLLGREGVTLELHPVIRASVWERLKTRDEDLTAMLQRVAGYAKGKLETLHDRLQGRAEVRTEEREEIIRWAIELFYASVGLHCWNDAWEAFEARRIPEVGRGGISDKSLDDFLYYFLGRGRDRQYLLDHLLDTPAGQSLGNGAPPVENWLEENPSKHALILRAVARGEMYLGETQGAAASFQRGYKIMDAWPKGAPFEPVEFEFVQKLIRFTNPADVEMAILSEAVHAQRLSGRLREAEWAARKALALGATSGLAKEDVEYSNATNLYRLGMVLSARGETPEASIVYGKSLDYWEAQGQEHLHLRGFLYACLAQQALWMGEFERAHELSEHFSKWFSAQPRENNTMTASRLLGTIAMERGDLAKAQHDLNEALTLARGAHRVEEELLTLAPLAELLRRQRRGKEARAMLVGTLEEWGMRGSYPCLYADGFNVLAAIERDAQRHEKAGEAAREAYKLAWCDGPPFAYHGALETAKSMLAGLKAELPETAPFDEARFPAMPGLTV